MQRITRDVPILLLALAIVWTSGCHSAPVRELRSSEPHGSDESRSDEVPPVVDGDPSFALTSTLEPWEATWAEVLEPSSEIAAEHEAILRAAGPARAKEPERPWTGPTVPLTSLPPAYTQEAEEDERWSSFLPIWGDKARERGYELPLPFGIGTNFFTINRPTNITKVRAGVDGAPLQDVNFLQFDAEASVQTLVGRFDTWVLPMLNVYLLGGYIWNQSTVEMSVDLPGGPGTPLTFTGDLEGPLVGVGATAAGGYKQYFGIFDANFTRSELGRLSEFEALLLTVRLGISSELGGSSTRFWIGSTYWDTARTISGQLDVPGNPGIDTVSFAVDQEPEDPWTLNIGTTVAVTDWFWLLLEVQGWNETRAFTGGVAFRF